MPTGKALIDEIRSTQTEGDQIALWQLGQMGLALKTKGVALLIDAFLDPFRERLVPPAFDPTDSDCFDAILGSHDHDDHIDIWGWMRLAKANPNAVFIASKAHKESVCERAGIEPSRFLGIDEGECLDIKGVRIEAIAAAHEFIERDERGCSKHLSFIIDGRFFHAGDTLTYDGQRAKLRAFGQLKGMLLPVNGRDAVRYSAGCIGNMTYQEAVDLAGDLAPRCAIPGHYDMFANNLGDPIAFRDYLNVKYPSVPCVIPERFERLLL